MKRPGVLTQKSVNELRQLRYKFDHHPTREDVGHLVDTVDAMRLVIERHSDGWDESCPEGHPCVEQLPGWWVDRGEVREPEELSQAEQLVVYDRVVRPEAPRWPGPNGLPAGLVRRIQEQLDSEVRLPRPGREEDA